MRTLYLVSQPLSLVRPSHPPFQPERMLLFKSLITLLVAAQASANLVTDYLLLQKGKNDLLEQDK